MKFLRTTILFSVMGIAACSQAHSSPYVGAWKGATGRIVITDDQSGVIYPSAAGTSAMPEKVPFMWQLSADGNLVLSVKKGDKVSSSTAVPSPGQDTLFLEGDRFERMK